MITTWNERLTPEGVDVAVEMLRKGESVYKVADVIGLTPDAVYKAIRKARAGEGKPYLIRLAKAYDDTRW